MASLVTQFANLCDATGNYLRSLPRQDATIEAQQVTHLGNFLNRFMGRPMPEAAMLSQAVQTLPISEANMQVLSTKISNLAVMAEGSSLKNFQDWTNLPGYYTEQQALDIQDNALSSSARMQKVCLHAYALGLRNSSEPTFQVLTAVYLMFDRRAAANPYEKKAALDSLKTCFRRIVGSLPERLVMQLPLSPAAFRDLCPLTFEKLFGDSPTFITIPEPTQWNFGHGSLYNLILDLGCFLPKHIATFFCMKSA